MMTPFGMLTPLADVLFVMGTEVVTILATEMVLRPALVAMVAIVGARSLIFRSATIVSTPVLRKSCAREEYESGS